MKACKLTFIAVFLSLFFFACSSKDSDGPANTMDATIGTTAFSAKGSAVLGVINQNTNDNTKMQLTVTGAATSGILTVAVTDYKGATGTFSFISGQAIGGFGSGSGSSDVIVFGNVIITSVTENQVQGTFSGTTQAGVTIANGSFSIKK